ncbi:helix-turn-helix domain-containing protein [Mesorhizobium sp.]|uniref:helix-turn-helix domain-containing protein n=1 Tax=Mesorhizobium sp. TaxID=1871066 RepID=UPI000FE575BD|nr:helix-turn-helix domain-containing protein [Mesorhizobium sp.]RWA80832.1 MAG: DNA-binding protein [Mesorhizobium sp.]TIV49394.1 MAG: helix-turn-helix domain-containing protein [Mesorhizobium sp.]
MANFEPTNPETPAISVDFNEAARLTGLSRARLYEAAASGLLPVRKSGRRSLLLVDDLKAFIQNLPKGRFKKVA